jgi:hypothetical protein
MQTNNTIIPMPAMQLYIVKTNQSEGTTGDTSFISNPNEMYTGKTPNLSITILKREIKNRNQQIGEEITI